MIDKTLLLEAVNTLVRSDDAGRLFADFEAVARLPPDLPIKLSGDAAVLNPLLALRRQDRAKFDGVIELIESKREAAGAPPLRTPETPKGFDKVEYQRLFMDQKRHRERRAVLVENMRRPGRDKLIGNARLEFMRVQAAKWKEVRDAALNAARETAGRTLAKAEVQEVLSAFWQKIDRELDDAEAEIRQLKK
jgi:hypothetical protein